MKASSELSRRPIDTFMFRLAEQGAGFDCKAPPCLLLLSICFSIFIFPAASEAQEPTRTVRELLENGSDGPDRTVGLYLKEVDGPVLASLEPTKQVYPASTIKVLEHLHTILAMDAAGASEADKNAYLDTTFVPSCPTCRDPGEECTLCTACPAQPMNCEAGINCSDEMNAVAMCGRNSSNDPIAPIPVTLRCALQRMMYVSDNRATNVLQEFFGAGDPEQGREAMNMTAMDLEMDSTMLGHKFGCGNVDNEENRPFNMMTLEDIGKLYEAVADDLTLLSPLARRTFYQLMLNDTINTSVVSAIEDLIDEEAFVLGMSPTDADVESFKSAFKLAYKAGSIPTPDSMDDEDSNRFQSLGGWIKLPYPAPQSDREYVFGYFIYEATTTTVKSDEVVKELLRLEVRKALEAVLCQRPPVGAITSPRECDCFGPSDLPVEIADDFTDACTASLTRTYAPDLPPFVAHGDHEVRVTAEDQVGMTVGDRVSFTIDLVAPDLEIRAPETVTYGAMDDLPIAVRFASRDADGATGGVVHERVLLDGEVVFDGRLIGDFDGRLSDEIPAAGGPTELALDLETLCAGPRPLHGSHTLAVEVEDCGGNVTRRTTAFEVALPDSLCADRRRHTLVINEIDYDQGEVDEGEFLEIKNTGTEPVDLKDYALRTLYYGPFETQPRLVRYDRYRMMEATVPAGGYFVVCTDANPGSYCDQRVTPIGWGLVEPEFLRERTAAAAVALVYSPDQLPGNDRIVDSICYFDANHEETDFGVPGGIGGESWTEGLCNNQPETVPEAGLSRVRDGQDRDSNRGDLRHACISPGASNTAALRSCAAGGQALGQLVINEVDLNQPEHPDTAEFLEIKNTGTTAVVLGDFELVHRYRNRLESFFPQEKRLRLPGIVLAPDRYFVLCAAGVSLPECDHHGLFTLNDSNGVLALVHNLSGQPEHDLLIDSLAYGTLDEAVLGGPAGGGSWVEGDPEDQLDGRRALDGLPGTGLSRVCDGADRDHNATDFRLLPISPGALNFRP